MTPSIKQRIEQIRRGEVPEGYKQTGQNIVPITWKRLSFDQVAVVRSGLVSPKAEPYSSMLHIGPENIEKDTGKIENVRSASELGLISGKFYFDSSSIVYSKIRPNLNKVCVPDLREYVVQIVTLSRQEMISTRIICLSSCCRISFTKEL